MIGRSLMASHPRQNMRNEAMDAATSDVESDGELAMVTQQSADADDDTAIDVEAADDDDDDDSDGIEQNLLKNGFDRRPTLTTPQQSLPPYNLITKQTNCVERQTVMPTTTTTTSSMGGSSNSCEIVNRIVIEKSINQSKAY